MSADGRALTRCCAFSVSGVAVCRVWLLQQGVRAGARLACSCRMSRSMCSSIVHRCRCIFTRLPDALH
eukprot:14307189-Alexandrium_andersonii.AAC.1